MYSKLIFFVSSTTVFLDQELFPFVYMHLKFRSIIHNIIHAKKLLQPPFVIFHEELERIHNPKEFKLSWYIYREMFLILWYEIFNRTCIVVVLHCYKWDSLNFEFLSIKQLSKAKKWECQKFENTQMYQALCSERYNVSYAWNFARMW